MVNKRMIWPSKFTVLNMYVYVYDNEQWGVTATG